jgi:hypothetical protein
MLIYGPLIAPTICACGCKGKTLASTSLLAVNLSFRVIVVDVQDTSGV